jgi:CDP-diacylglycerol pyrophosphatase
VQVNNLESIWATAANVAIAKGLDDYGVLVAQSSSSGYMVVVTPISPEAAFTIWKCE